ncbi:hypothetical protein [Micromonospora sp. NPDC004704]
MGDTVEIYLSYSGPGQRLAHRVAETLDLTGYFHSGEGYVFPVDARPLIGVDGWGQLTLDAVDRDPDAGFGDGAGPDEEVTAYAPYGFELSLDFRGPQEQLGRAIFDRLTGLDLSMAYGDYLRIFADFRPGRGTREFPPDTPADGTGQRVWSDLTPAAAPSGDPLVSGGPTTGGRVAVFDTGTLLQIVPMADDGRWRWSGPVASVLRTLGDDGLGVVLDAALHPRVVSGHVGRMVIESAALTSRLSVEDLLRGRGSIEVRVESGEWVAVACGPSPVVGDAPGPVIDGLVGGHSADAPPEALGGLVRDLLDQLAARLGATGRS